MLNTRKNLFYILFYYVHTIIHMAFPQVGYGGDPSRARCREASDARASRYRESRV